MPPLSRGWLRTQPLRLCRPHPRPRGIATGRDRVFRVSEEVQDALHTGKPVVALETTIYTHGFPYPENVAFSSHLESLVRINGGIPATIGILNGVAHVGMDAEQLIELVSTAGSKDTWKVSRRDLGFLAGFGLRGQKLHGGTTIAGTMILAHLAGIKIFATGGLGGVHRGGENSMDISADLTELGRTPVAVISSGCKSFLDIPRTLEYLETQGVGVGTFADGRTGSVDFPAFFSRDSGVPSPRVIRDEADAAAIVYAQSQFPIQSGLLLANPVPLEAAMEKAEIDQIIEMAVAEAEEKGIGGAANTPYILKRIRELSNGGSVNANRTLVDANVVRGTKVAVELAKLELRQGLDIDRTETRSEHPASHMRTSQQRPTQLAAIVEQPVSNPRNCDLLVAGSLASDTICDYAPLTTVRHNSPALHTSNPSNISQYAGGVGRNVATAAHLAGANVVLASVIADDIAGSSLLEQISKTGIPTKHIRQLKTSDGARTAQYVAVNDTKKDLMLAMADMSILSSPEMESLEHWKPCLETTQPKWVVVDSNWSPSILASILTAAKSFRIPVAFEPVSTAKAARFFHKDNSSINATSVVPNTSINLATPNIFELGAMYEAARQGGFLESEDWWKTIDSMGMSSSGSRDRLTALTTPKLVEQGIPQQNIQLLPFIPNLVTKLGPHGCLLTQLLKPGDPRLTNPDTAPYVLARNLEGHPNIGGIYMRLIPPSSEIQQDQIVSVNGIGDTMLGVIMAGLVKGRSLEEAIPLAQEAAVLSLQSNEAVAPAVRSLRSRLD